MSLNDFRSTALTNLVELNQNKKDGPVLTGEKNLDITKEKLMEKVRQNTAGETYLKVITGESRILEGQGLIEGRIEDDGIYFKIPDWDAFISAVNAFYEVCWKTDN